MNICASNTSLHKFEYEMKAEMRPKLVPLKGAFKNVYVDLLVVDQLSPDRSKVP